MKRIKLSYLTLIASIIVALISCHRRDIVDRSLISSDVLVSLDWSNMSETPSGMTLIFYPDDGSDPIVIQSNSVSQSVVSLTCAEYNILAFNQIPSDFSTLSFTGLDSFDSASVYAATTSSSVALRSGATHHEPEELAASTYTEYSVTRDISSAQTKADTLNHVDTLSLKPVVVVRHTQVRVNIEGHSYLQSTSASLSGMADGYNFSSQQSLSSTATHSLSDWSSEESDEGSTSGVITTTFTSFGLTSWSTSTRNDYGWSGTIDMDMLLVDGSTVVSHTASLDNRVTVLDNTDHLSTTIFIELGFGSDSDDDPPSLPQVDSSSSSSDANSFNADVEEWADEELYHLTSDDGVSNN